MIHFRRTLSLSPPTSTPMFSHPSTSSALRLRLSMPKLQCRVFENYLQSSPISTSIKYRNYSQLRSRKSRVTCMITPSHSKVGPIFHAFRTSSDGCQHAFGIGSLNPLGTGNIISHGYLGNGSRLILPDYRVGVLSKRFFSQPSYLTNKVENEGTKAMRCKNYFAMNRRKKREKALAAQSNDATVSCISKDAVSAKEDAKLESSVYSLPITKTNNVSKSNVKKKPKSKKIIEQDSVDNATAEAVLSRSSEGTSQKKKSGKVEKGSSVSIPSITNTNKVSTVISQPSEKRPKIKKTKKQDSAANAKEEASSSRSSEGSSQKKKPGEVKKGEKTVQDSELKVTLKPPVEVVDTSSSKSQRNKEGENNSKQKISVKSAAKSQLKPIPEKVGEVKPRMKMIMKQLYPATGRTVVVVESVTKAKVIQGYLGDMFEVLPSYGHVRDLAARSGSVRPDDDFSMVWEVPSSAWTHLKSIKVALSGAENLILASDPDREGEAIAWHIIEMLHQQDALHKDIHVARVVFHEITEASIKSALQAPREIDENLVYAYLARRALDYLIGFNISPLLWKKLPSCKSAGRVQSAALALVCDREMEIDEFKPQEYWSVDVELNKKISDSSLNATSVPARLTHFDSKKLDQLSISSYTEAKEIERRIISENFQVISSKNPKVRKNPPYPYITSTLQQDAANRLHFGATHTMKLAQKLYEGVELSDGKAAGLITYMRTDGLHISDEAVKDIRSLVVERYGQNFASGSPRKFFKKVKNAQEAHEAIRPTDVRRVPSLLKGILDEDSLKLYTLIWCRTVACQMEPATIEQIQLDIGNASKSIVFRSSCSRVGFLGYQAVFEDVEAGAVKYKENEGIDRDEAFALLNLMKVGAPLYFGEVKLKEHYTQPPSRYSESSLVKKLEELGIGRPSTYASTLKVLQDREYLTVKSRRLHPEFRGRMVSAFLSHHFSEVTDYSFTADMETELDNVSAGLTEWKGLLRDYWTRFSDYCERTSTVSIHQVEKMLEKKFGDVLFAALPDPSRTCPSCNDGTLIFKVSRFGAGYFIGCNAHPQCKYIAKTLYDNNGEDDPCEKTKMEEPKLLGLSPSGLKVLLKSGPYGAYVQLGEDTKGHSPKRTSLGNMKEDSVTLEVALNLLQYPLTLGPHPTDGQPVIIKLSKLGVTVKKGRTYATAPKDVQPGEITMEYALKLLSGKVKQTGRPIRKASLQEIEV